MKKINFGIIGASQMAVTMMSAFKHSKHTSVVAVASQSGSRAQQFATSFTIAKAYGSTEELLTDHQIDAVYIANANENHAQSTIAALKAGKAVLCEKPIAISESQCREIAEVAQVSGNLCMEAMWTLFLPAYEHFLSAIATNKLGNPLHFFADFGYPQSKLHYPKAFMTGSGSGVLLDRGVYPIALALKAIGAVSAVSGQVLRTGNGVDTHASLNLSHENGCLSQLTVSIDTLLQNRAVLSCTEGSISLEPPLLGAERIRFLQAHPIAPSAKNFSSPSVKQKLKHAMRESAVLRCLHYARNQGETEFYSYGVNQYLPMLNHFCTLYQEGQNSSKIVPLSFSSQVLNIIDQAKAIK
ncbi:MAG: Gfo/Idh/MocA family protein [Methylophilaceae bacterium]